MRDKLPNGWVETTLGEICTPSRMRVRPNETLNLPYVGLKHVESQTMRLLGYDPASGVKSSSAKFSKGDVLYGKMRPYLNKVWLAEFDGLCSAEFLIFPKSALFDNLFLAYRLNAQDFVNFANQQVRGERPRVDFDKLAKFEIWLPPKNEQERIVAILDELHKRIAAGEAAARRALKQVQNYRIAVLDAAIRGELTREWRETHTTEETGIQLLERLLQERQLRWEEAELLRLQSLGKPHKDDKWKTKYPIPSEVESRSLHSLPNSWGQATLEQLTLAERPICYGILMPKQHVPDGVPYVKVRDMKGDKINVATLQRTSSKIAKEYARATLKEGDLVLAIRGTYGQVAAVPPELDGGNITQDTARLAIASPINVAYVMWAIRSGLVQSYFKKVARGIAVQGVNIADVRQTPLPLPPLDEQAEIVRQVERRLGATNQLEATLHQQLERSRVTRQSLLQEAFSGKLVPQNADDESASVLLEHIRAARKLEANKPKIERLQIPHMPKSSSTRRSLIEVLSEQNQPISPEQLFRDAGFQPADADAFYRELAALRPRLQEKKPDNSQDNAWPHRSQTLLELKEN